MDGRNNFLSLVDLAGGGAWEASWWGRGGVGWELAVCLVWPGGNMFSWAPPAPADHPPLTTQLPTHTQHTDLVLHLMHPHAQGSLSTLSDLSQQPIYHPPCSVAAPRCQTPNPATPQPVGHPPASVAHLQGRTCLRLKVGTFLSLMHRSWR